MQIKKQILCVDDDVDDFSLLSSAITDLSSDYEVLHLQNGQEALDYLVTTKQHTQRPCLILLDINMPVLDGKKTLEKIEVDPELENIPVIIFSSSQNPQDFAFFKSKGVEMYSKPTNFSTFKILVQKFLEKCN